MRKLTLIIFFSLFAFNFAFGQDQEKANDKLDKHLVAILDTIFEDDQKVRTGLGKVISFAERDLMNIVDSINTIKVKKILDERGWLGADVVGNRGNLTLFLVIQHSDLETQEKYLPMMQDAVKNGNASPKHLAYLEDRVALKKGEKQIYGSQIMYLSETGEAFVRPLIDPENVDKRRAEIGLGTMQDYLFTNFGLNWDVEEYKKKLLEYEANERMK